MLRREIQDAVFVQRQERHPVRILDSVDIAVGVPTGVALLLIHVVHQLVRRWIIGRHRRSIPIERVEHARSGVDFNRLTGQFPVRIQRLLVDDRIGVGVRLLAVVAAMTAGQERNSRDKERRDVGTDPARQSWHQ